MLGFSCSRAEWYEDFSNINKFLNCQIQRKETVIVITSKINSKHTWFSSYLAEKGKANRVGLVSWKIKAKQ